MNNKPLRQIKSFVLRTGRLTTAQQQALVEQWPLFGIDYTPETLVFKEVFGRDAPVTLEIGFGNGRSLSTMASNHRDQDFIGVEVHTPGVGQILQHIAEDELTNLRVIRHDALDVLEHMIPSSSLDKLQLFFPDPWHKRRHHKRRIVQRSFTRLVASRLKPGGILHMATDWEDYARHMLGVMQESPEFENTAIEGEDFSPRPDERPITRFERRGHRLGHGVWDLLWRRKA
ncbi:MAG: tRNA (guanosine(46)-N7)-methyltransferase TrmB [bacterium]